VNIGRCGRGCTLQLLWRGVARREWSPSRFHHLVVGQPRDTEVEQTCGAVSGHQHIGRLDIPMNHTVRVRVGDGRHDLLHKRQDGGV
jgi:hypothetical protein